MIAIIGAMAEEVNALLGLVNNVKEVTDIHPNHYLATINNHEVVILKTGIGKVEAAYRTTKMFDIYDIELVINIGSAGGLQLDQRIGDVVIGTTFNYHDLILDFSNPKASANRFTYSSNPDTVNVMKKALDELNIRNWSGNIVSGDQFISEPEQLVRIKENFPEAICVEMEATAIAHVCSHEDIPFIVIRSLSDIPSQESSSLDFDKYLNLASKSSANACLLFLHKWVK